LGLVDCLCADYAPASMLAAAFALAEQGELDLPAAVRLTSLNPARAGGLEDRGEIALGKRADLIAVRAGRFAPQVVQVWTAGRPVFEARFAA